MTAELQLDDTLTGTVISPEWSALRRDFDALEFGGFEWAKRFLRQCYDDSITPTEGARRLDRSEPAVGYHTRPLVKIAKTKNLRYCDLDEVTPEDYAEAKRGDLDELGPRDRPGIGPASDDEWYTPKWLFDALGLRFSIDVCSPVDRTHVAVPATRWFTESDNGLVQPWSGTVWCNPPYSSTDPWARQMILHGDGLILCHVPMNAGWCTDLWQACDGIRLFQAMEFVRPDGSLQRPAWWLQLAAFGPYATDALARLKPPENVAENERRVPSPMWRRA